jgi:mannose-6-phosphate isomerase-like protein (cupin superfamily)
MPVRKPAARPVVRHLNRRDFKSGGLRSFFQYRDLGIAKATRGRVLAHVIRATPSKGKMRGHVPGSGAHTHALDFQMVYVLKGRVRFEYEGYGQFTLKAGSAVYQPPGICHREIWHSPDVEMIEITMPARFATKPAAIRKRRRR